MDEPSAVEPSVSEGTYESYGALGLDSFSRSLTLQRKAEEEIPEATSSNHRGKGSYAPYPMIYMEEGNGAELTDVDGNSYIDFHCGVSAIINGHGPEAQEEAVKRQVERGPYFATTYELEYETAKLMNELVPGSDLTKFISTGTEAVMSALRLARAYTGKEKVLKFEGMYHGHTDYALVNVHPTVENLGTGRNATKIPETAGVPGSTLEAVETVPWNDTTLLEEKLERQGDEIAAVITEAVMSNSGLLWPQDGYLEDLRRLTREHDVLLILDEVVTGFRMGLHGAQGYFDIEPDLSIFGKAMANGYPCAALTGREDVMRFLESGPDKATFMGTFSGNPLVVAAAHANLELLNSVGERGYADLYERGERLTEGFEEILTDAGHDVFIPEFAGFFCLHFTDGESDPSQWHDWRDISPHTDAATYEQFASRMVGEGIFLPPKGGRINLMHAHTDEHIDEALEAAKESISHV
ncbi:aspartate aminotransferase family protein [Halorarum salinum]|uniref:Glutamate-1-semialdehyde 2,1-aminomutase n=1 Tax=Halorarum salinum TaxID=2743089 RepID=A0A7D5L986_9EURY|nr:aspartate aminotransferase family protein [Halobaculum salinum]QLG61052.1 aspartate aminotransferase family protein [Halobaculum salinum]